MKTIVSVLFLVLCVAVHSEDEVNWYVFGGLSSYFEDSETIVGAGFGSRIGLGAQINERFGLEFRIDKSAVIDEEVLVDELERDFGRIDEYDIEVWGNLYISLSGTITFPISDRLSWNVKAGVSGHWVEAEKVDVERHTYIEGFGTLVIDADLSFSDSGTSGIVSTGVVVQATPKNSFEISVTNVFGSAKAISINGSWRYMF